MSHVDAGGKDGGEEADGQEATYCLSAVTIERHLRMDTAAAAAVTLLPDPTAPHQYGSLYNVLNRYISTRALYSCFLRLAGSPFISRCDLISMVA